MCMTTKLKSAISSGEWMTSKQIKARFGLKNPRATIHRLRHRHGVVIDSKTTVNSKGQVKHKYTLGVPSAELIAGGYRALAMGL